MDPKIAIDILTDFERKLEKYGINSRGEYHLTPKVKSESVLRGIAKDQDGFYEVKRSSLGFIPYALQQLTPEISSAFILLSDEQHAIGIHFDKRFTYIQHEEDNIYFKNGVKKATEEIGFELISEEKAEKIRRSE
jgi:hypothetical protein